MIKHVQKPPARPVLVYDANCDFCKYWSRRWRDDAGLRGERISLQDAKLKSRFPEIPRREWEQAIHLVDTTGAVYAGAEAVLRFRAKSPRHRLTLKLYEHSRTFAFVSEGVYRVVSRNRPFFSRIWGTHP